MLDSRLDGRKWSFAPPQVAADFDFHIENSVPLYHHGHDLIIALSDFFLVSGSVCYDLGCATACLTAKLATHHANLGITVKAVDVEPHMIAPANKRCRGLSNVELVTADITELSLEEADLIVSYYTLQFIQPKLRQGIVAKIYQALNPGSAFLLFEKIVAQDAYLQEMATLINSNFKLDRGFKASEIIAKANSLRGVMKTVTAAAHQHMLATAGFSRVFPIMKYMCFEGYLAIK